jgi:hypothetical protein
MREDWLVAADPWKRPHFHQHEDAEDPRFVESVRRLERSGASLRLVHLPAYSELRTRSHLRTRPRTSFLASLERLAGERVIRGLERTWS